MCALPNSDFASGGDDGLVIIWKKNNSIKKILTDHTDVVRSLLYLRNNSLASGSDDLKIVIWDLQSGIAKLNLIFHQNKIVSFAQLPNDNLVSASWDQYLAIWNVTSGELVKSIKEHTKPITSIILMFNNKFLISGSHDGRLIFWNIDAFNKSDSKTKVIIIENFLSIDINFSIEKLVQLSTNSIAIGYEDLEYINFKNVILSISNIFSVGNDERNITFTHKNGISSLVLFGVNYLASASINDNTIKIWNLITNKLSLELKEHSKPITSITVLENGMMVSASEDSKIIIRDIF